MCGTIRTPCRVRPVEMKECIQRRRSRRGIHALGCARLSGFPVPASRLGHNGSHDSPFFGLLRRTIDILNASGQIIGKESAQIQSYKNATRTADMRTVASLSRTAASSALQSFGGVSTGASPSENVGRLDRGPKRTLDLGESLDLWSLSLRCDEAVATVEFIKRHQFRIALCPCAAVQVVHEVR